MDVNFTVSFLCHDATDLLEELIPHNMDVLCGNTSESYDVILTVDGAESTNLDRFLSIAKSCRIDEVRYRYRGRNCADGDPSNNGHLHLFSDKTPYLMTLEGDVVIFKTDPSFDILGAFRRLFQQHGNLCLATRIDDHDCWVWKLEDSGPPFEQGVRSVNRVASHFLVYDTARCRRRFNDKEGLSTRLFHDNQDGWYNYEDFLSHTFSHPEGPGIAHVDRFPIKVFHCDEKIAPGSVYYTKDLRVKSARFSELKQNIMKM